MLGLRKKERSIDVEGLNREGKAVLKNYQEVDKSSGSDSSEVGVAQVKVMRFADKFGRAVSAGHEEVWKRLCSAANRLPPDTLITEMVKTMARWRDANAQNDQRIAYSCNLQATALVFTLMSRGHDEMQQALDRYKTRLEGEGREEEFQQLLDDVRSLLQAQAA
jgi:hypothetical protein